MVSHLPRYLEDNLDNKSTYLISAGFFPGSLLKNLEKKFAEKTKKLPIFGEKTSRVP
jgi:hypothetical protein